MHFKISNPLISLIFITVFHFIVNQPQLLTIENQHAFQNLYNYLFHPILSFNFNWVFENASFIYSQYVSRLINPLEPEAQLHSGLMILAYLSTFLLHIVIWIKLLTRLFYEFRNKFRSSMTKEIN